METVASTISDPDSGPIEWSHSRDDIVEAVEQVFSAIKDREGEEAEILKDLWEIIEKVAKLGGDAVELPILASAAAAFAPFAAIGAGYMDAADEIKRKEASMSFAEGLVMGVMADTSDNMRDLFWEESPEYNPAFEEGGKIAQYYSNGGLAIGYAHGKQVNGNGQGGGFWSDLKSYVNGPLPAPDPQSWARNDWRDYYIQAATAFYRGHITA
jgi:hypothetical protein